MKKTLIMMILSVSVFVCSIAGCGKDEEAAAEKTVSENTETSETVEEVCDGCQKQKECSTYTVDGKEYIVCDDCYEEFATGMAIERECSLCEVSKACSTYEVDGEKYIVCDDCYNEFATAFGLND